MVQSCNDENWRFVLPEIHIDANLVQQILETCINGATIIKLTKKTRDLPYCVLKKCLFYLITFGLVSYQGEKRIYKLTSNGFEILLMINDSHRNPNCNNEDIVIYNQIYCIMVSNSYWKIAQILEFFIVFNPRKLVYGPTV